jgi:glycerol-3-phosphate O-acyltransferase / dihydroxyacetone phosphate acyltransferase
MPGDASLVHGLARAVAHLFYRIDTIGTVPDTGPLLLLPNHPNALLDPALVMATAGRPVRFLAKSTLFSGPFGPLMRLARAVPVYRRNDGAETKRNTETFAAVDAALARGEAICIFPEGISHSSGRLETLRTGAARMALSAVAQGIDVRIVPVGINLEQKTVFRSAATVAFGTPFTPVSSDAKHLTGVIAGHMRSMIVEADPVADAALVERVERLYRAERPLSDSASVLDRRRLIAAGLHRLRTERPEWYEAGVIQLRRYDDRLERFGLRDRALDWAVSGEIAARFALREIPRALVLLPVCAAALVVFGVPYAVTAGAARLSKEADVTATAKVIAGAVLYGLWILILASAAAVTGGPTAGVMTGLGLPVLAIAGLLAIERQTAVWRTARSWLALRSARPATRHALKRHRAELATLLDHVGEWLTSGEGVR